MHNRLKMPGTDRTFRILGFTDTHIDGNEKCGEWSMRLIKETVIEEKPDLVVFVGDNVTGADNMERSMAFTDLMTELAVPWCPVLGNHEGDNSASISRDRMMDIFRSSACCAVPEDAIYHKDGRFDYAVNLETPDGNTGFKLIFMDGGAYMSDEELRQYGIDKNAGTAYSCLGSDQIAWYRGQVRNCGCSSIVFCHIPLPEFRAAEEEGSVISGANREGICCPMYNSGMFEAMAEEGSSIAFIAGHDHINDSHILYRGIRLIYNRMSGFSSYNVISKHISDRLIQGCTVYEIHADGHVEYGDILYDDRYPQYMNEILKVIRR